MLCKCKYTEKCFTSSSNNILIYYLSGFNSNRRFVAVAFRVLNRHTSDYLSMYQRRFCFAEEKNEVILRTKDQDDPLTKILSLRTFRLLLELRSPISGFLSKCLTPWGSQAIKY